ncbi:SUMO-activating enzyme subunit 1 [Metopolophium dirhodum]|uniref:SUMO-activating enzyme subunit 1 n=1 Tax=Metopolophium dirhodum TaxID=44670 RepID=UPI00298FF891|nr:SUMO-activating enzyme subunit 1 [Metopolophium dirhodum]XP_060863077.1 SUMO-activating enzyme subunit 1 [Metopolophium dirhodum]XP_060863078.1 SUMO-activating enzyme subunit 1 [Metopolophium dirhodum]
MASELMKNGDGEMSKDERKVYDRQIRLWGFDGQNKLRATKVLLIGMQGLGAEIAKNLILSGVNSITMKDHTEVSILDRCSQFLIPRDSEERNRAKASLSAAQKLNPNVKVIVDTTPIEENVDSFVASFDVVIATECSPTTYKRLSENCRNSNVKIFIADVYGLFGYFYQDVISAYSLYGEVFPNNAEIDTLTSTKKLPQLYYLTSALLKFQSDSNRKPNPDTSEEDIEELKSIIHLQINYSSSDQENKEVDVFEEYYGELFCELSPTTSIIGAMVAQTALNTVMNKPVDNYNVFFYDHIQHEGKYHLL